MRGAKALSVISIVLLVLAIAFCALVIFQVITQGYVSVCGFSIFRVVTPSMEPELPVDTLIISQKVDIYEIREGDIISFVSKEAYMRGSVVTHRVVEIREVDSRVCLVTRGDANNSVDAAYVTSDNLVGKMVFRTREGGVFDTVYGFVMHKQVFFVVIILPMLLVAGILFRNGIKKIKDQITEIKEEIENDTENAVGSSDADNGEGEQDGDRE